ncbi:hypothetical protein L218DRAFT_996323 [Marasmius fiardii PR-910]|nr:hypothetical protein L218DRAFT_996323 [Marasmius fiardii PR-910]
METDPRMRLDRRPQTRSVSDLYEDLGSGFNASGSRQSQKKSSERTSSRTYKARRNDTSGMNEDGSDSDDALLLSEDRASSVGSSVGHFRATSSKGKKQEKLEPEDLHEKAVQRTNTLKTLKFKKNKPARSTDEKSTLKENQRSRTSAPNSEDSDSRIQKQLSGRNPSSIDKSPASVLKPVPQKSRNVEKPMSAGSTSKPQATSSQSSEKNSHRRKPTTRSNSSQNKVVILSSDSEEEEEVNSKRGRIRRGQKLHRASDFPCSPSPERTVKRKKPREFPVLSPLQTPVKQSSHSGSSYHEDLDRTPVPPKPKARQIPLPSPLSSQPASDHRNRKRKGKEPHEEPRGLPKTKPFPMAIGGSPGNSPLSDTSMGSRSRKRLTDDLELEDSSSRKRKRQEDGDPILDTYDHDEDEDYDSIFNSDVDPKKLCPFCDAPLPKTPSPLLQAMVKEAIAKSKPDPRPTNRLGRKTVTIGSYIHICQRHDFESVTLPQAEAKGWPKTIEFDKLEARVAKLKSKLQEIIADDQWQDQLGGDSELWELQADSPRALCVFWQDALKEVREKGSKVAANVKNQFSTFHRTQPGYYGELGSVIIHHALYELFPPASIEPKLVEPLDPKEFIRRVLVPEVGVRLIMEDRKLRGASGFNEGLEILRESSAYGVAMFPDDGGGGDLRKGRKWEEKQPEITTVDAMLQEKARRRRKELEEEEREEDAIRKQKQRNEDRMSSKGRKSPVSPVAADVTQPTPRPRPKPKRVGKASSQIDDLATESTPSEADHDFILDDNGGDPEGLLSEKDYDDWDELSKAEAEWNLMDVNFRASFERSPSEGLAPPSPTGSQASRSSHRSRRKAAERANSKIFSISSEDSSDEADPQSKYDRRSKGKRRATSRAPKSEVKEKSTPKPQSKTVMQQARGRALKRSQENSKWGTSLRDPPPSPTRSPGDWLFSDSSQPLA